MHQLPIDLGSTFHLDDLVIHIAGHARLGGQRDLFQCVNVADHGTVQHDMGHAHIAFNSTVFADRQRRCFLARSQDLALDLAINVQSAGKANIAKNRSEEHTSELQSLMRISYAVFCLTKKTSPTSSNTPMASISAVHTQD